jgi:hypothetical protein
MVHSTQNASEAHEQQPELRPSGDEAPKPKYEKPILLNLGDIPRGLGQSCNTGSAAQASCVNGLAPKSNCVAGAIPPKL